MRTPRRRPVRDLPKPSLIRIGYIPLLDAAPLIVAHELGYFSKYGLQVKISAEAGWATIRDKILFNELDAAHSLSCLPFVTTAGLGCVSQPTTTGFVFNLHGNGITLSNRLRERGVTNAASLRQVIQENGPKNLLTFGVVFPYSSHAYLLKKWLRSGGIDPEKDLRIVVLPPPQMFSNLASGNLDGYCVGEPWNSQAILNDVGWCPVVSAALDPSHPEKVLMTRGSFARQRDQEHLAIIAGLIEGARFCEHPLHREELMQILAQSRYLDISAHFLKNSLGGRFYCGHGQYVQQDDFILFHRFNANEPTYDKALRVLAQMRGCGALKPNDRLEDSLARQVFNPKIYQHALQLAPTHQESRPKSPSPLH